MVRADVDLVAGRPAALANQGADLFDDVLVDTAPFDRFDQHIRRNIWCRHEIGTSLAQAH